MILIGVSYIKILFMGTDDFAVPVLQRLQAAGYEVAGVFTQPDRPRGRGKKIHFSPVKAQALAMNLTVYQPESVKDPETVLLIESLAPEVIIVVAYGQIIPASVLTVPEFGCINVHASLLPAYRGAAPIERALMAGEHTTGINIMQMDEGLDSGAVFAQQEVPITPGISGGELRSLLSMVGAEFLLEVLPQIFTRAIQPYPQVEQLASYAHKITRQDELIDWQQGAYEIHNMIRALYPQPGAYTWWQNQRLKILQAQVMEEQIYAGLPGEIVAVERDFFLVKCGCHNLRVDKLMQAGRKALSAADFLRGSPMQAGTLLGVLEE